MTTPSSDTVKVLGVLVDPAFLCQQTIPSSATVHGTMQSLWTTFNERVHENPTSEISKPSIIQVLLREIGPFTPFKVLTLFSWSPAADLANLNRTETTFPTMTLENPAGSYIIMFGMPSSWSHIASSNKENVVAGMANLSMTDDGGSRKLAGGSNGE
jgi:hypothetical protein